MRLMLDASFLVDHLRGQGAALARWDAIFRNGDEAFVNEVAVCEVRTGLRPEHEEMLVRLLEPIEFVQPGPEAAITAGRWRHEASARGYTLSLPDSLIASAADALHATVLTRNLRDFALTPVAVESY